MSSSYPLMDLEGKRVLGHKGNSLSPWLISFLPPPGPHERHLLLSRVLLGVSHSQQLCVVRAGHKWVQYMFSAFPGHPQRPACHQDPKQYVRLGKISAGNGVIRCSPCFPLITMPLLHHSPVSPACPALSTPGRVVTGWESWAWGRLVTQGQNSGAQDP